MTALPERMMLRGKTFYCRIWVPVDVAAAFGRKLVIRSLKTQDLKVAKLRLARATVELDGHFEAARSTIAGRPMSADTDSFNLDVRMLDLADKHGREVEGAIYEERASFYRWAFEDNKRFGMQWSPQASQTLFIIFSRMGSLTVRLRSAAASSFVIAMLR